MLSLPDSVIFVIAVAVAIMVLTIFFKTINWIGRMFDRSPAKIAFKGILNEKTLVTVHLTTGKPYEGVRLLGFTDASSVKDIPYQLHNMVILEHDDGRRSIIQAKSIRSIEVGPNMQ
jgi:hypothetical protein